MENRALEAMLDALDTSPGRPSLSEAEQEVRMLRDQLEFKQKKIDQLKELEQFTRKTCDLKIKYIKGYAEKKYGYKDPG
jgi:hypothetical protein